MRTLAKAPKDAPQGEEALLALTEAWVEYARARTIYVQARQHEVAVRRQQDFILEAQQSTAAGWHQYSEAIANLKAAHKTWKAIFSKMDQERQL